MTINSETNELTLKDGAEEKSLIPPKQVKIIDPIKATSSLGDFFEKEPAEKRITLRTYSRRWAVLAVVALLNNLNTMLWIAFSPISNHVDTYYGKDSTVYFSAVYIFVTIPIGILAMWTAGNFGLRLSILIAAYTNGIGAMIRLASSFLPDALSAFRFSVGITGQGIAGLAYPFIMFLPTKVAAAWFPDNQRTIATTIGVMANPLGVLIANLISPMIVQNCEMVQFLNIILAIPSIILTIIASVVITRSEPQIPPTLSASKQSYPFFQGIKECFTNKQYLVLVLVMGGGIGMFNTLYTLMQKLLCPSGYSNLFSGVTSALLITGGIIGATGASIVVDRTKFYEATMKAGMAVAVMFGMIFLQLILHRELNMWILSVCLLFGIFGLAAYPVGLQLSAECTYPVSETTSTGIVVISGQIQTIIYLSLMTTLAKTLQPDSRKYEVCTLTNNITEYQRIAIPLPNCGHDAASLNVEKTVEPMDFTHAVIAMSVIATVIVLILILFFHPKLRRTEVEKGITLLECRVKSEENELDERNTKVSIEEDIPN